MPRERVPPPGLAAGSSLRHAQLRLACIDCGHCWQVSLPGRLLRVKGRMWLIGENGACCRLTRPACPSCAAVRVYAAERL